MSERFPTTGSGKGSKKRDMNLKKYNDNFNNIKWKEEKKNFKKKKK